MKILLTMTMALGVFCILEQNAAALDFKAGSFQLARGERHIERGYPERSMGNEGTKNMEGRNEENMQSYPEGHLQQNYQNRNEENWGDGGGWTGSGSGCMTDSNGNLICP